MVRKHATFGSPAWSSKDSLSHIGFDDTPASSANDLTFRNGNDDCKTQEDFALLLQHIYRRTRGKEQTRLDRQNLIHRLNHEVAGLFSRAGVYIVVLVFFFFLG